MMLKRKSGSSICYCNLKNLRSWVALYICANIVWLFAKHHICRKNCCILQNGIRQSNLTWVCNVFARCLCIYLPLNGNILCGREPNGFHALCFECHFYAYYSKMCFYTRSFAFVSFGEMFGGPSHQNKKEGVCLKRVIGLTRPHINHYRTL